MTADQNKYRLLIDNLPEGFAYHRILTDEAGVPVDYIFLDVNQAFEKLTGLSRDQVVGKKVTGVIPGIKESDFNWIETYGRVALTGSKARFEQFSEPLSMWYDITAYSDEPGYFITIFHDITEAKKTEEKYKKLAETAGAIFWEYNIPGDKWTYIAPQVVDILGYTPEEWARKQFWTNNVHPEDRELTALLFNNCITQGCDLILEYRFIKKNGEVAWLRDDLKHELQNGKPETLRGFIVDITEHKNAEIALQESEKRFKTIMDSMQDTVFTLDCELRHSGVYGPWVENAGLTPEYFLGKTAEELMGPEASRVHMEAGDKALQGNFVVYEWSIQSGKQVFHYQTSLSPMRDDKGNITGLVGVGRDISARKLVEEKIRYLSMHDNLTLTYNRNYLDEEMKRLDTQRQLPISMIMADLNGLKLINDTYGHNVGDRVLISAADILRKSCRQEDIIARWGGDEFVILLPRTSSEEAWSLGKRIERACSKTFVNEVPVSMALGVACKDDPSLVLSETLKEAENSMYKQKLTESRSTKNAVLKALLKTLEAKSFETEAHAMHMLGLARKIGEKIKLTDAELNRLSLLITLHDIGKINISEEILTKKEPLTAAEWETVKRHPEIGFRIARATEEFAHVADDILAHHERWDGHGYPQGLKGEKIPLLARITAIADAYEVMVNGRPYKSALSREQIIAELKLCAGTQFDPELVEISLSLIGDADTEFLFRS
jgi:diguanylate cyclase